MITKNESKNAWTGTQRHTRTLTRTRTWILAPGMGIRVDIEKTYFWHPFLLFISRKITIITVMAEIYLLAIW
jgi:hypothetical protein